ncbi:tetratricopeptide repeat protein [Terracidiphilus gabretensis]|uniref:tetratricopeptide repeat protein n=1 Tax=Terracidiphilus gabretensis TaxID=1577687 RepID=UPI00071B78F2|nr:tetratricopeptide repeat protein [Terracidiphilus gabretensis]
MIAQTQHPPLQKLNQRANQAPQLTTRLREVAQCYQQILAHNPRHAEALAGMSLIALASRQPDAAVRMAQAAVTVAPAMSHAWVVLGQALRAAGQRDAARDAYGSALRLDSGNALAHTGLGELEIAAGKPEDALPHFTLALERDPSLLASRMGLGHALGCLDRFAEALVHYEQALACSRRLPEGEFAVGFALARLGRMEEAERRYRRAISLRPDFAAGWMNLGCLLRDKGSDLYAEAALRHAVELRPDLIAGWVSLAVFLRSENRMEEAEQCLQRADSLDPDRVETHIAWAQLYVAQKHLKTAWEWLAKAQSREAEHPEVVNMQGILLHNEGRFAEAVSAFDRAEALGSIQAVSNRGNSLLDLGRVEEALDAHRRAADADPVNPGMQYNLALTQIRSGQWAEGWANYEARWRFREVHRKPCILNRPRLTRERLLSGPLHGERVLLHAEQGLGDTIQFCRYAALIAAHGGFPVLQVQARVERLIRSLAIVRSGDAEVCLLGAAPSDFDLECPLMSLPALFGTTVDTVPWEAAYLSAALKDIEAHAMPFPDGDCGYPRIGIAWAGNPRYKADARRSTTLATLQPLLETPGIDWISLQKGEAVAQLAALSPEIRIADGVSNDRDLADTATLISTLDLVITTDTSIAHLAGSMAKPVWILLPWLSDWRWMQQTETTPWYPTARLFRQPQQDDWKSILRRVAKHLTCRDEFLS